MDQRATKSSYLLPPPLFSFRGSFKPKPTKPPPAQLNLKSNPFHPGELPMRAISNRGIIMAYRPQPCKGDAFPVLNGYATYTDQGQPSNCVFEINTRGTLVNRVEVDSHSSVMVEHKRTRNDRHAHQCDKHCSQGGDRWVLGTHLG